MRLADGRAVGTALTAGTLILGSHPTWQEHPQNSSILSLLSASPGLCLCPAPEGVAGGDIRTPGKFSLFLKLKFLLVHLSPRRWGRCQQGFHGLSILLIPVLQQHC